MKTKTTINKEPTFEQQIAAMRKFVVDTPKTIRRLRLKFRRSRAQLHNYELDLNFVKSYLDWFDAKPKDKPKKEAAYYMAFDRSVNESVNLRKVFGW